MAAEDSLIDMAVRGDREALANLLQQYGPGLREGLRGKIPQRWQALLSEDDIMQQTYADAVWGIRGFVSGNGSTFPGWLATLRNNNLRDAIEGLKALKRGGGCRQVGTDPGDQSYHVLIDVLASASKTPSRCASREEARGHLARAIQQLPEDYRQTVQMYDLEGRPVAEVAAALKRSPGAVFMLRARAHSRLVDLMGPASAYFSTTA
jgi:RNA polymerase sigma factor (sigma-70 family)